MYLRTSVEPAGEPVPENVPDAESGRQVRIHSLKEKIKMNIADCRKSMVKTKETPTLHDSKGNFPTKRGRGHS